MSNYNDYFSSLGLNDQEVEKAEQAVTLFEELYGPYRFETAFISSTADSDKSMSFDSLWLFADDLVGEAKNFLSDDVEVRFSASVFAKRITLWELNKENYTVYQAANADSKLALKFTLNTGTTSELLASGENCKQLATILERYIIPNLPE